MQRLNCDYFTEMSVDKLKGELTKTIRPYQGQIILSYRFLGYAGQHCYRDDYEPPRYEWVSLDELLNRKSPPIPSGPDSTTKWNVWSALVRLGQISEEEPIVIVTGHPRYTFAKSYKALFVNTNDRISQYDHFRGISKLPNNFPLFSRLFNWRGFQPWGGIYIGSPLEMAVFNQQLNPDNDPKSEMVQFPVEEMLGMLDWREFVRLTLEPFTPMSEIGRKISKSSAKEYEDAVSSVSKYVVELKQAIPPSGLKGSDLQHPYYSHENADQIKSIPLI